VRRARYFVCRAVRESDKGVSAGSRSATISARHTFDQRGDFGSGRALERGPTLLVPDGVVDPRVVQEELH
jgi:hypothetical protein